MGRMDNALIANGGSFSPSPNAYMANVVEGGQNAFGPMLVNLDANTPPVFLPMVLTVTHIPEIFNYIPNGPEIFKAIMETHLITMDGIDISYSMDVDGTPIGRDGQVQNIPVRQQRSQITPSCMWAEKIGNVIWNWGRFWMNAMHDPDTQASSLAGIIASGTTLPPLVASMYSADIMLTQYDATYRPENIIDAIHITNFFPTDIGSPGYTLSQTEAHRLDRTFTFTGIAQHNNNTIAVAKELARYTNLHTIRYQDATPISTDIDAELQGEGLERLNSEYLSQFENMNV